jgi:hypothetical protein
MYHCGILTKKLKNIYKVKLKIMIGLGDLIQKIISIVTFGQGKRFATWVAKLFGYKDCGCDKRQEQLNKVKINIKR